VFVAVLAISVVFGTDEQNLQLEVGRATKNFQMVGSQLL